MIEFYSTFRVGEPACSIIRKRVPNLWMISRAPGGRLTEIDGSMTSWQKAVWLFRSWRCLFQAARITGGIWIYGFDSKLAQIRALHSKLNSSWSVSDDDEFEDDLPKFLKSITKDDLERLIADIERNLVLEDDAKWKMYTVHSFKGMEHDYVRISSDITLEEENLYYVAITRALVQTVVDVSEVAASTTVYAMPSYEGISVNNCKGDGSCIQQCFHKPHMNAAYAAVGYCPSSCKYKCVPQKCMFWEQCKQRRPKCVLDGSKGQCFDCRIGI
jgi:superfamily I DNA/RNA helicase